MKPVTLLITILSIIPVLCFSQVLPAQPIFAGKVALSLIKDANKRRAINESLQEIKLNEKEIDLLRVPKAKIYSKSKSAILSTQNQLDIFLDCYKKGKHIIVPLDFHIIRIKSKDLEWPIEYYETEFNEYKQYDKWLTTQEILNADSLKAGLINKE